MFPRLRIRPRTLILFGLLAFALAACAPPPCSTAWLVLKINNANSTPGTTDIIDLAPACLYELATVDNNIDGANGLPSITSPIIINGNDATIRRSLSSQKMAIRLFHVSANGDLTLNDLTLLDGLGMHPPDITLPLVNNGGAIFNNGQLKVYKSVLVGNRAIRGGGIYNAVSGVMTIDSTSIISNKADISSGPGERGGGIRNDGQASISNSTIANNFAWESGGGIANSGPLRISNSTLSGNSTFAIGGSAIHGHGDLMIEYSTISNNYGGPTYAIFYANALSTVELSNTIIADNPIGDCLFTAPVTTLTGANLDSDGSCTGFSLTANPLLDPLANNGGPTDTHALQPASPAMDAALGSCPASDQRGQSRPGGPACDLGSYEDPSGALPTPVDTPTETPTPTYTPTPTPTFTPTPTETPTPVPLVCVYTAPENTNCRESDYAASAAVTILMAGETAELIALNPEFTHGKFELMTKEMCWIWLGLLEGPENPWGDCNVPLNDPATPLPPVCSQDLDQDTCEDSGGKWSAGAAAAPHCVCP